MKKIVTALCATVLLVVVPACSREPDSAATADANLATETAGASDPIDGTWKADLASVQIEEDPGVYLLKDGRYDCSTCVPPLSVAADGAFHAVVDRPYYDSMSMTVVDENTVRTVRRKGEAMVGESTLKVAPDGKTLTSDWRDAPIGSAPAVTGQTVETRVGPAPAGAHAISGSWKTAKYKNVSDEGLTVNFDAEGNTLSMTSPAGTSYAAKFGGPAVPIVGDTGGTTVAVERLSPTSIRETSTRDGKVVNVTTLTVTDGKLQAVSENRLVKSTMRYSANKV